MKLAEQMSCSVVEAKKRVTQWELMAWIGYWDLKHQAEMAAAKGENPMRKAQVKGAMETRRTSKRGRR